MSESLTSTSESLTSTSVLALVGIIILLSQMSTSKIARKVNKNATYVLATLTLLSYAKLLHTIQLSIWITPMVQL